MCQVYQIVPASSVTRESFIIKINNKSVIINCSGQFQRNLEASSVNINEVSTYIFTDVNPETLEDFILHLKTYYWAKECNSAKIIVPKNLNLFHDLSFSTGYIPNKIHTGELIECKQSIQIDDPDYLLDVQNVDGQLEFQIQPKLEQVNYDKEKIKNISKQQMCEISQKGFVKVGDQIICTKDISSATKCGKIVYGDYFNEISKFDLVISSKITGENVFNMKQQGYPIKDFVQFYNKQCKKEFSFQGHQNKKFVVFPQKQFGFDLKYDTGVSQRDFNLLNKDFVQCTENSDSDNFIEFYGSQGTVTSKYANVSGQLLQLDGHQFLVDCGVGTLSQILHSQRQTRLLPNLVIMITHEHTDHYFGLGAVLSYFYSLYSAYPVVICPDDVNYYLHLLEIPVHSVIQQNFSNHSNSEIQPLNSENQQLEVCNLNLQNQQLHILMNKNQNIYDTNVQHCFQDNTQSRIQCVMLQHNQQNIIIQTDQQKTQDETEIVLNGFKIKLLKSVHSPNSVHFSVMNPSKSHQVIFTGDGRPFSYQFDESKCKILVHEATFVNEQSEAETRGHSTFKEAVDVYRRVKADLLIVNHLSLRHQNKIIVSDSEGGKIVQAFDFMVLKI
ncbi:TRNA_processing endoribonuclease Trz1 [Hexamita inflata]|uniref:ribonuclease Z n=1 Tax=Hexamita inflata TaxID=28002 RepID=A0AA86QP23_9EUKA|nr:TRNA processing endoribonuclease Trz1 [Hexamita inflata]